MSLDYANKYIRPMLEHKAELEAMTKKEKINYIKDKYGLHHGKGKRKRKKR